MSRIVWDQLGSRKYEVGVDRGVLYQDTADGFTDGVPWNGLIGIDTDSAGGDVTPLYSGDTLVDLVSSYDELEGTINAYTYPDEFDACIGSKEVVPGIFVQQQGTSRFGLSYRSLIGNDVSNENYGYKIHLIYNCELTKVSWSKSTINDSAELEELGFDFRTIPIISDDYDPYSELIIDSTRFSSEFMEQLEDILYGTGNEAPRLPTLEELVELFYVEEPVPPEWNGYPYMRLYTSKGLFPTTIHDTTRSHYGAGGSNNCYMGIDEDGNNYFEAFYNGIGNFGTTELQPGDSLSYTTRIGPGSNPIQFSDWNIIRVEVTEKGSSISDCEVTVTPESNNIFRIVCANTTNQVITWEGFSMVYFRIIYDYRND